MNNRDIYAVAHLLIQQYGEEAAEYACQRMAEFMDQQDSDGIHIWLLITTAINDLQRLQDSVVH